MDLVYNPYYKPLTSPTTDPPITTEQQGGHSTGKTGNLDVNFSRQGKHREFGYNTGKKLKTQGKKF